MPGEDAVLDYGMDYYLGRSCWHVIGYLDGDLGRAVLLCGGRRSEYGIGGGVADVLASDMRVCKTCDRATHGQASGDVWRLRTLRCSRCDDHGQVWDPRAFGNVVSCDHEKVEQFGRDAR